MHHKFKGKMISIFQYLYVALIALAFMAVTSVSAGKGSVEFLELPQDGWHAGDEISFKIKIDKEKHAHEFMGEKGNVSVIFERSRFGPNKKFELEDLRITPVEGDATLFTVTGVVPKVDKKSSYAIKIKRKRSMWFGKKTIAKSNYNRLKIWRWFSEASRRKVTIDPTPSTKAVESGKPADKQDEENMTDVFQEAMKQHKK